MCYPGDFTLLFFELPALTSVIIMLTAPVEPLTVVDLPGSPVSHEFVQQPHCI
jgi:hypothetical protein